MTDFNFLRGRADKIDPGLVRYYAESAGLTYPAMMAFMDTEAPGGGFDRHGAVKRLFEPHYFYKQLVAIAGRDSDVLRRAIAADLARPNAPPLSWYSKRPALQNFLEACKIDETAAILSCSWGAGQVMGVNYKLAGWATPQAMVLDLMDDEDNHIRLMVAFLKANRAIVRAMNDRNWPAAAMGYNGKGYKKNRYDEKLAAAYAVRARQPLPALINPTELHPLDRAAPVEIAPPPPKAEAPVARDMAAEERRVDSNAAAAPAAMPGLIIKAVQTKLLQLGYFVVGKADGLDGPNTKAGVAKFMADNGMEGPPEITQEIVDRLETAGPARLDPERAKVTVDDLRKGGSVVIKQTDHIKTLSLIQGIPAFVVMIVTGASDYLGNAWSIVQNAKTAIGDVPVWVWVGAVMAVSIFLWWKAKQTQDERVAQERDGRNTLIPKPVAVQADPEAAEV